MKSAHTAKTRALVAADTLFKVAVCHPKTSPSYGVLLYPILSGVARCGWLGPWTKSLPPNKTSPIG